MADQATQVRLKSDHNSNQVSASTQLRKPQIENKDVALKALLKKDFGIEVSSLKLLDGYYDLNFHVTSHGVQSNPYIDSIPCEGFFLKISNLMDSKRPELISAITKMMEHLCKKGIVCQKIIKTIKGQEMTQIASSNLAGEGVMYLVSVRTFLPGQVLAKTQVTSEVLYNLGAYVANVTQALQDFYEPYFDTHDLVWNLTNCPNISEILYVVEDANRKKVCADVLRAFETRVLSSRQELRAGQIHGDLHENNILVSTHHADACSAPQICGLLDLNDTSRSYLVYDLAICAAHVMMMAMGQAHTTVNVTEIPGHLLAGYRSVMELCSAERRALRTCIAARMVMYLVTGQHTHLLDPDNLYLVQNVEPGWKVLETFWAMEPTSLEDMWDEIVRSYRIKRDQMK